MRVDDTARPCRGVGGYAAAAHDPVLQNPRDRLRSSYRPDQHPPPKGPIVHTLRQSIVRVYNALHHCTGDHDRGAFFSDHDRWCLRIAADGCWHDRGVYDP